MDISLPFPKKSANIGDNVDGISKLPVEVISHTISFLTTKHAVSTSILSKRWEYIWTLTPNLDFSDQFSYNIARHNSNNATVFRSFKDYVDQTLGIAHVVSVDDASMHRLFSSCPVLDLLVLSGDAMSSVNSVVCDSILPTFHDLTKLVLYVGEFINWESLPDLLESSPNPEILVFPAKCLLSSLKTIEINNFVEMSGEKYIVEYLLESAEVLEEMIIPGYKFFWKAKNAEEARGS
ncbi:unnamed protein product [Dovyalis caffra]|uniref:F-box domain-containing protein n=1 Tax=Dovyalis caffra TaxID=77055 RepID=A0AAV1RSY1_9ROSI|nr:unnamed protein product [Dovyalis caffra]